MGCVPIYYLFTGCAAEKKVKEQIKCKIRGYKFV